jgi:hypothetical protein
MGRRERYGTKCVVWFLVGAAAGFYLPATAVGARASVWIHAALTLVPFWMHLPAILLAAFLAFDPCRRLQARYSRNLTRRDRSFTPIEAVSGLLLGLTLALLLNGSLARFAASLDRPELYVLGTWSFALVLFGLGSAFAPPRSVNSHSSAASRQVPLLDSPITEDASDSLGRVPFVDDLYRQIKSFPSTEPFVFGLNGPWGSGKTSALNLLRNRLRSDSSLVVVDFDPWYYSSVESLIRAFYSAISNSVNKLFFYPELVSATRRYSRTLSPVLKRYGIELPDHTLDLEEAKARVQRCLLNTGRRLVVIIDDLDRCEPKELLVVFQILRLTATFNNTLFVLAYDEMQLRNHLQLDAQYLDKIVQLPIQLPAADRAEIDWFILYSDSAHVSQVDALLTELGIDRKRRERFDKEISPFYPPALRPFFTTLRSAKRYLSAVAARLPAVKDEVDLFDFALLEVLRIFEPEVYNDIWENRGYYLPNWTLGEMQASPLEYALPGEEGKQLAQVRAHVEIVLKNTKQKDEVLRILRELFYVRVEGAFSKQAKGHEARDARARQRLTHPECFDKYFLLGAPRRSIPDSEIAATFAAWVAASKPEDEMARTLRMHKEAGNVGEFLEGLRIFLSGLDHSTAESLALVLAGEIASPSWERGMDSDFSKAYPLIIRLLNMRIEDSRKSAVFMEIVRNGPALDLVVQLTNAIGSDKSGELHDLQRRVDVGAARECIGERFRKQFVETGADIFRDSPRPGYVLYQIGIWGSPWKELVNQYVIQLCASEPSHIGQLIEGFLLEWDSETFQFNRDLLESVYDAVELARIARAAGEQAWNTPKEKRAVEIFLSAPADEGQQP